MIGRAGRARLSRFLGPVLAGLAVAVLAAVCPSAGWAELPAPSMMPNSPILAGDQVIVLWLPVPGAVKYNVYLDGKKQGEAVGVQHMLPSPQEPGQHAIELTAVDAAGKEGARSRPGFVTIVTLEPPGNLLSRFAEGVLSVRWDRVKGAVIYNVYRSEKPDGDYAMIASLQTDTYTDSSVKPGKTYYYQVTAKDLAGKESKRSQAFKADIPAKEAAEKAEAVKLTLKVAPSHEDRKIVFIGRDKLTQVSGFTIGPDNFGYIVDSYDKKVRKFELSGGDVVATFGKTGPEPGSFLTPNMVTVSKAGEVFVSDASGKILVFDGDGRFLREIRVKVPDPVADKVVYENSTVMGKGGVPSIVGLAVDDKNGLLYAACPAYNTIYVFTVAGEFKGFLGHGGNTRQDLALPTELFFAADGKRLFITQPPTHEVRVWDVAEKKQVGLIGERKTGYIGGFIGVNGATLTPRRDVLLCDSGIHSIQVFSGETYDYLYHIGGPEPKADPEYPDRAKFDFNFAIKANFDKDGQLYIMNGIENYISVRNVEWDKATNVK